MLIVILVHHQNLLDLSLFHKIHQFNELFFISKNKNKKSPIFPKICESYPRRRTDKEYHLVNKIKESRNLYIIHLHTQKHQLNNDELQLEGFPLLKKNKNNNLEATLFTIIVKMTW